MVTSSSVLVNIFKSNYAQFSDPKTQSLNLSVYLFKKFKLQTKHFVEVVRLFLAMAEFELFNFTPIEKP